MLLSFLENFWQVMLIGLGGSKKVRSCSQLSSYTSLKNAHLMGTNRTFSRNLIFLRDATCPCTAHTLLGRLLGRPTKETCLLACVSKLEGTMIKVNLPVRLSDCPSACLKATIRMFGTGGSRPTKGSHPLPCPTLMGPKP